MKTLNELLFTLLLLLIVALLGFAGYEKYQNYQYAKTHQNDTQLMQSQQLVELQKLKSEKEALQKDNELLTKDKTDLMNQLLKKPVETDYAQQINSLSAQVQELSKKPAVTCPERKDETSPKLWSRISDLERENNRLRNSQVVVRQSTVTKVIQDPHDKSMLEYYGKLDKYQKNKISSLESKNADLMKKRQCEAAISNPMEEVPVPVTEKEERKIVAKPTPKVEQSRLQSIHKPLKSVRPDELPKKKVNTQVDELN